MQAKKIGLIGAAAVFASLSLFGGPNASADWSDEPDAVETATSSDVPTTLWCTWFVSGLASNVILYSIPTLTKENYVTDGGDQIGTVKEYDGSALTLTGFSLDSETLVAGWEDGGAPTVLARAAVPDPYDCSWYNTQQGSSSNVSILDTGNQGFIGTYSLNGVDTVDGQMSFGLDSAISGDDITIVYAADPGTSCEGFTLAPGANIAAATDVSEVASVNYSATLATDLECQWDTTFTVQMPGGKFPVAPGELYTFTGPTLVTTTTFISS